MGLFDFLRKKDDLTSELEGYERNMASEVATNATLKVEDIFTIIGRGSVVVGKVEQGKFRVGDSVEIVRQCAVVAVSEIAGIEAFRKLLTEASAGDEVGILLKGLGKEELRCGDLVCKR